MENKLILSVVGFWTTVKKYISCSKIRLNLTRLEGGY